MVTGAKKATKIKRDKGANEATTDGEDDVPKDQEEFVREDADDAELDDEKTRRDARDYAEFLNWKAGEKRLRDEERKIKFRAMLKEKERKDKVQVILKDEERKIHLQALKEMERRGKFEDAQAFRKQLKLDEPDEEEIEQEEENVQAPYEGMNEEYHEDIFCSPENKDWMTASQALPEARKRQIEARVAAWKKKIRDEVIAEIMAKQNGKDGEVVEARADGQTVGEAKAEKDNDSLKTPLKPKIQKTLKIIEVENSDEDITPKMIKSSELNDEEEEVRRQYEESMEKLMKPAEKNEKNQSRQKRKSEKTN
jgi:hypothetical protein